MSDRSNAMVKMPLATIGDGKAESREIFGLVLGRKVRFGVGYVRIFFCATSCWFLLATRRLLSLVAWSRRHRHTDGDVLARISLRFGRLGQYGPCAPVTFGIATLKGRGGDDSSADMSISSASSADQPSVKAEGG